MAHHEAPRIAPAARPPSAIWRQRLAAIFRRWRPSTMLRRPLHRERRGLKALAGEVDRVLPRRWLTDWRAEIVAVRCVAAKKAAAGEPETIAHNFFAFYNICSRFHRSVPAVDDVSVSHTGPRKRYVRCRSAGRCWWSSDATTTASPRTLSARDDATRLLLCINMRGGCACGYVSLVCGAAVRAVAPPTHTDTDTETRPSHTCVILCCCCA